MQYGGGAYIDLGGSANFNGCNVHDNEATQVRARILELLDPSSMAPLEGGLTGRACAAVGRC